jgi:hypothetical protein
LCESQDSALKNTEEKKNTRMSRLVLPNQEQNLLRRVGCAMMREVNQDDEGYS